LFVASTHDWLLFFTDRGRVFRLKVYDLPLGSRTGKGRAVVNLLSLQEGENVVNCAATREFGEDRFLMFATRGGVVKKTKLSEYANVRAGGIIAIDLREDTLVEARIVFPGDDVLLATSKGMAIRFAESNARAMGRAAGGVRGIRLTAGDAVIGMVVADAEHSLLTVCENGYGKRTPFGAGGDAEMRGEPDAETDESTDVSVPGESPGGDDEGSADESEASNKSYRRQGRGGKGIRDIRATSRNGPVVKIAAVAEGDEVLMITAQGMIQRIRVVDISEIGRNTQGVRVMRLEEGDKVVSLARVPSDLVDQTAPPPPKDDTA
jgi:DNA gyrase subunit A